MFDVRNRARDDAVIRWTENGVEKTKDCPRLRRCSVFIRFIDPTGRPRPVVFRAIIRANGKALNLNKQPFIAVKPLRYQKIIDAVIENKGALALQTYTILNNSFHTFHPPLKTKCPVSHV